MMASLRKHRLGAAYHSSPVVRILIQDGKTVYFKILMVEAEAIFSHYLFLNYHFCQPFQCVYLVRTPFLTIFALSN